MSKEKIDKDELKKLIRERVIEYREQAELANDKNKPRLKSFYNGCKSSLIDLYKTLQ